jgi:predicted dithiol-disulfide oxidoreductase (DUF899 family)
MSTETQLTARPPVVSRNEWQAARDALMVKEKAHTRAKDALSAERRRLPMVEIETGYWFQGPGGRGIARCPVRGPEATDSIPIVRTGARAAPSR